MDFLATHLPPPPARVLDAGCGDGLLADELRGRGYDVTAIDIDPELARPGVLTADVCEFRDGQYDAVLFVLSLHHTAHLGRAVEAAAALLAPGGRLLVDEFAHERAGTAIADRFYDAPGSLQRWRADHRDLHTGTAMVDAIAARFGIALLESVPYLYRYLEDESLRDAESVLGLQLVGVRERRPA